MCRRVRSDLDQRVPRADAPHALALPAPAPREQLQLDGPPAAPTRTALALLGPPRLPAAAPAATLQLPDLLPGQHAASCNGFVTQLVSTRLCCITRAVAYAYFLLQYHISLVSPSAYLHVLYGPAYMSSLRVHYLIGTKAGNVQAATRLLWSSRQRRPVLSAPRRQRVSMGLRWGPAGAG